MGEDQMLKGYALRDYTWKDWILLILSSSIVLQMIVLFGASFMADLDVTDYEAMLRQLDMIAVNATVYGTIISLPLTLLVVHWRKIPIFNRRQIPKSDWFIVPGMTRKDWSFLVKYIPISFVLYVTGNVLMTFIFGETEASNQVAIESLFDYIPVWVMFIIIVIVAPIAEEVLFRGLFLFSGKELTPSWFRVLLSAVLFAIVHQPNNIPAVYSYLSMGIMFSYASKRTQSVEAAMVYHFLNNLMAFFSMLAYL